MARWANLAEAAVTAGKGRRSRPEIDRFFSHFETRIAQLGVAILEGNAPFGIFRKFTINDPKKRIIHAPCFEDRVAHHAFMRFAGPVLERALVESTFACRPGKGPLAAVNWVQRGMRRYPWYVKVDVQKYFDSIDHEILKAYLNRRFKGKAFSAFLARLIEGYRTQPGKGLPIGALTSQYFANGFLDGLDRFLLENLKVLAHARYMDDLVWWCGDREQAKSSLETARQWLAEHRKLNLKEKVQINRSSHGVTFCGYRILPGTLRLSARRRKRYLQRRKAWEMAFLEGYIDALQLQKSFASVNSIVAHADSLAWRKESLRRHPAIAL